MPLRSILNRLKTRSTTAPHPSPEKLGHKAILEQYVTAYPNPQNALDIFRGEWASRLPEPWAHLTAGNAELFDDGRIKWLAQELGAFTDKTILELGPLEGGHSYMLERLGAAQVIAVEANTRAYLKCLIIKDLLQLQRVQFLCGDFIEYLRQAGPAFELCIASGVLYHMQNPAELLALLAARCSQHLLLWTHYYDPSVIAQSPSVASKFSINHHHEYMGFQHTLYRYDYQDPLKSAAFCGGSVAYSYWLNRADLFRGLQHFGFGHFRLNFDHPQHVNGPAIAIIAERLS